MELIPLILIIFSLVIVSFIMAASESAFFSLKKWQLNRLEKNSNNASFKYLIKSSKSLISTLALGSTTSNALIIALFVLIGIEFQITYFIVLLCILLFLIALFCEILPKTLAIKSPSKWALVVSKPIYLFHLISAPIRILAENFSNLLLRIILPKGIKSNSTTTEDEFAELIDWAYQQGVLERSEREIMEQIIKLDQRTAEEAMKPRSQMICIEDDTSVEKMILAAKKHKHTRLPIFNETPDNIVGILNTRKLLLYPKADLEESIEFPSFVPSSMNLMDLLLSLQMQRRGLAIVLDEFGGTAGLISIEDILEELVGEMREEGEKIEFTIEKLNRNRWRVNGSLSIEDFQKSVPELRKLPEVDTMGGLIVALKEVVPKDSESITYSGFKLTAVATNERRVKELIVTKLTK